MSLCCNKTVVVKGTYKPLSTRLLDFGNEVYSGSTSTQRILMWVFSFFDEKNDCPVCRDGLSKMYGWFNKYGLTTDPVRGVRMVLENRPDTNLIYQDLGIEKLPVNIFTDSEGKVIDIIYEFPDEEWLDAYILPLVKKDTTVL